MERSTWQRLIRPLTNRISRLLRYGKLTRLDSAKGLQQAQIKTIDGQPLDGLEVWEPYGFTSAAKAGAEALAGQVGGQRGNDVIISISDRRFRLSSLKPGEAALYDDLGNKMHLTRSGIVIEAVEKVTVNTPIAEVNATDSATVTTKTLKATASTSATVTTATLTATATASTTITSPTVTIDGNGVVTGALQVTGPITALGGLIVPGNIAVTNGDITADGISLKGHKHAYTDDGTPMITEDAQ